MLLAVDVGNTQTVLGLFDDGRLADHWRLATEAQRTGDELGALFGRFFDAGELDGICLSSTVPTLLREYEQLAERLRGLPDVPGAGAAGGLGGAFAALGAELVPGAGLVLDEIGFDPRGYDLVVTGEGAVDEATWAGKAPGEVVRRCREAGVRCELFSARDDFSGDPSRARDDLFALGERLAREI